MKTLLHYLFSLSLPAFVKLFFLKASGTDYLVTGKCNCCGQCCVHINLRCHKGWIRYEKDFYDLTRKNPHYKRFSIVGKDNHGYLQFNCASFSELNGCRDYADRPDICRKYPNKSLVLQGGQLLKGCGYVIQIGVSFSKRLSD